MNDRIVIYESEGQRLAEQWWYGEGQVMAYNALVFLFHWYLIIAGVFFVGKIVYDLCRRDWGGLKELTFITFAWPIMAWVLLVMGVQRAKNQGWVKKIING